MSNMEIYRNRQMSTERQGRGGRGCSIRCGERAYICCTSIWTNEKGIERQTDKLGDRQTDRLIDREIN